jgi:hypothetical protein
MDTSSEAPLNPGDEAAPGTPGAAEDICDQCSAARARSTAGPNVSTAVVPDV